MKSSTQEDYNKISAKNVANIMTATIGLQLPELEELCKTALSIGGNNYNFIYVFFYY